MISRSESMRVSDLIRSLQQEPPENVLLYDFCSASPSRFRRGLDKSCEELAIDFDFTKTCTVAEFLETLESVEGQVFSSMAVSSETPVCADNYGERIKTVIDGVYSEKGDSDAPNGVTFILTRKVSIEPCSNF